MSIVVTTSEAFGLIREEPIDVEFFHDGHLEFPGHDIQRELAEHEFGYPETPAVRFKFLWEAIPEQVISKYIDVPQEQIVLLAADWAEHVAHFCKPHPRTSGFGAATLVNALEFVRVFVADRHNYKKLHDVELQEKFVAQIQTNHPDTQAKNAARSVIYAIHAAYDITAPNDIDNVAMVSRRALNAVCAKASALVTDEEYQRELAWQIRRFVDVMEAVGQELPWPPLEATP